MTTSDRPMFMYWVARAHAVDWATTPAADHDRAVVDLAAVAARTTAFCDQVDRDNAANRQLFPLRYQEAVVIEGSQGVIVVHRDTYTLGRVDVEARAGQDVTVTRGADLLTGPTLDGAS